MKPLRIVLMLVASMGVAGTACGHDHEESFDNLPDCVVDHSSLTEAQAIEHCLVDFPDLHPTFADQTACVTWVTDNGGYPNSRDEACTGYFAETGA